MGGEFGALILQWTKPFITCDRRTAELLEELWKLWQRLPVASFPSSLLVINLDFQLGMLCPTRKATLNSLLDNKLQAEVLCGTC